MNYTNDDDFDADDDEPIGRSWEQDRDYEDFQYEFGGDPNHTNDPEYDRDLAEVEGRILASFDDLLAACKAVERDWAAAESTSREMQDIRKAIDHAEHFDLSEPANRFHVAGELQSSLIAMVLRILVYLKEARWEYDDQTKNALGLARDALIKCRALKRKSTD